MLKPESPLRANVCDGMQAVGSEDKSRFSGVSRQVRESLNLDEALRVDYPQEHRWDYLLGTKAAVIAVEVHSVRADEVSTVIAKKKAAERQLAAHHKSSARIAKWLWVASGESNLPKFDEEKAKLAQQGITLAGRALLPKHLE